MFTTNRGGVALILFFLAPVLMAVSPGVPPGPMPGPSASPLVTEPGKIISILKPQVYQKVYSEREIAVSAVLREGKNYTLYAAMLTKAKASLVRKLVTDYRVYKKLIPYIDYTEFDEKTNRLKLAGGIWKWRLSSTLQFENKTDRWIHFTIIEGHFKGLVGDLLFEDLPDFKGSLVYTYGQLFNENWPPAFVIEQGAEIVFKYTAGKMRSLIEAMASGRVSSVEEFAKLQAGDQPASIKPIEEQNNAKSQDNRSGSESQIPRPKKGLRN